MERPGSRGLPGPADYNLRPSPLTVELLQRKSPGVGGGGGGSGSPSPLIPDSERRSPSIPFIVGSDDTPGPGEYTPQPMASTVSSNLSFGRSATPKSVPLAVGEGGGPGSNGNPVYSGDVGVGYKGGVPHSSLIRPYSPRVDALGRGASLQSPSASNPGPGEYMGPWAHSGFSKAALRAPTHAQHLGSQAGRDGSMGNFLPNPTTTAALPSPGSYNVATSLGVKGSGTAAAAAAPGLGHLGGGEPRFRVQPLERGLLETPGVGSYDVAGALKVNPPFSPSPASSFIRLRALAKGAGTSPDLRHRANGGEVHKGVMEGLLMGGGFTAIRDSPPPPTSSSSSTTRPRTSPIAAIVHPSTLEAMYNNGSSGRARSPTTPSAPRSHSPGPIYNTRKDLGTPPSVNALAKKGALLGVQSGRERGGGMAAQGGGQAMDTMVGVGPGSYNVGLTHVFPSPTSFNPALGPPQEKGFGTGQRSALGTSGGGEFTLPLKPWAFDHSFNALSLGGKTKRGE